MITFLKRLFPLRGIAAGLSIAVLAAGMGGCGAAPPLPNATQLTLVSLGEIQNDERLTDDEKRQMIRELVDAPNDEAGDRLVEFLFNFNIP